MPLTRVCYSTLSGKRPKRFKKMIARWALYKKDNGVLDISLDLSVLK